MVDRPHRDEQPLGDLRVRSPGADQVEHLPLASGQAARMRPGSSPGAGRYRLDAKPAHLLPRDAGGSGGAEVIEGLQRVAQGLLIGSVTERHRGVERAAKLRPQLGSPLPIAFDLQQIRSG